MKLREHQPHIAGRRTAPEGLKAMRPAARFVCGERVRAAVDLDDAIGSATLDERHRVARGTLGNVVGVGRHAKAAAPVYLVVFAGAIVVGCHEGDLDAISAASSASRRRG